MRVPLALAAAMTACLVLGGCTGQKSARDTAPEKSAAEKVREALAAQRAEEAERDAARRAAAAEGKLASINSVCPVTGEPVDPMIAPVTIEVLLFQPAEILAVGVANEAAAEAVRRDPERYAPAARRNQQARSTTTR
jgi:hypothetical protein